MLLIKVLLNKATNLLGNVFCNGFPHICWYRIIILRNVLKDPSSNFNVLLLFCLRSVHTKTIQLKFEWEKVWIWMLFQNLKT